MSGIGRLDTWDKMQLRDSIDVALYKTIEHHRDIERIAERFCNGDTAEAFSDIIEKGLQEYLDMCDLDDRLTETEAQMQNPMNGIVTSYKGGL